MNNDEPQMDVMSDMRQAFYYHANRIRMSITESRVRAASGDVSSLLNWCALLHELYTILSYWVGEDDVNYFEQLAEIEDKIIETRNCLSAMKSGDMELKWKSSKQFIQNYSIIQKELHNRQKKLYGLMVRNKMIVPMEEEETEELLPIK